MYDILSLTDSTLLTADMILLCTKKPVPNSRFSFPFGSKNIYSAGLVQSPSYSTIRTQLCLYVHKDRICGLVVRVPGYRSRGPGFDSRLYQIFRELVGLERDPLNLVSTIEKLLGRKSGYSGLEKREDGSGDPLN
jgi:hypothetical protein